MLEEKNSISKKEEILQAHFKKLINNYDSLIRDLIPEYDKIQEKVVNFLPFPKDYPLTVIDLGVGTGEVTAKVFSKYPNAKIIAVDIFPEMLNITSKRLSKFHDQLQLVSGNMYEVDLPKADAIVSVLALHHLTNPQKEKYYKKIYQLLNHNGVLSVGDLITFKNSEKSIVEENNWKNFLYQNLGPEQSQFRFEESKKADIPAPIEDQINWLEKAGFSDPQITWTHWNFATFGAKK